MDGKKETAPKTGLKFDPVKVAQKTQEKAPKTRAIYSMDTKEVAKPKKTRWTVENARKSAHRLQREAPKTYGILRDVPDQEED